MLDAIPRYSLPEADVRYPAALRALTRAPPALFCAGELPRLDRAVAIVGTRAADPPAIAFARALAAALVRHGCAIVSGGARGIDAASHLGALDAGGATVAVLATGLERAYPAEHAALFDAIVARGGAIVSEVCDAAPQASRFLERNRIVAALARAVVVVQAPRQSGALSTAAHARRIGRAVLVVPAAPWDPRGAGGLALLARGAKPCRGPEDVLAALGVDVRAKRRRATFARGGETALESRVLGVLGVLPMRADEIAAGLGLPAREVLCTLTRLAMRGIVEPRSSGFARVVRSAAVRGSPKANDRVEKPP